MDDRDRSHAYAREVETDLIETELLRPRPADARRHVAPRPRPALVSTEVLAPPSSKRSDSGSSARFAQVGRAGRVYEVGSDVGGDGIQRIGPVRAALGEGFQCLMGLDFAASTHLLARSGEGGLAVLDGAGATLEAVAALKSRGVLPVVHHLAVAHGVDAVLTAARARTVEQCIAAARKGFAGVLFDDLRRMPDERDAADLKKAVEGARAQAGHTSFSAILRGGDPLVLGHTWLVEQGLVSALVFEGLSYRATPRAKSGMRTASVERRALDARVERVRKRFPDLPLIAIDHAHDRSQAEKARARARALGFDVSHVALDDAMHERLSCLTTVGLREDDQTVPLGKPPGSRPR